jgi:hypothetical protein
MRCAIATLTQQKQPSDCQPNSWTLASAVRCGEERDELQLYSRLGQEQRQNATLNTRRFHSQVPSGVWRGKPAQGAFLQGRSSAAHNDVLEIRYFVL